MFFFIKPKTQELLKAQVRAAEDKSFKREKKDFKKFEFFNYIFFVYLVFVLVVCFFIKLTLLKTMRIVR